MKSHSLRLLVPFFAIAATSGTIACGETLPIGEGAGDAGQRAVPPDASADAFGDPDALGAPDAVLDSGDAGACGGPGLATDGFILFDSNVQDLVPHIFAVRADGCVVVQITSGASGEQEPALSPDGKTLLYTSAPSGTPQIYAMNLGSKAISPITTQAAGAGEATFSPDGATILYASNGGVFIVNADGSGGHQVLPIPGDDAATPTVYGDPVFTPDGMRIVTDGQNTPMIESFDLNGQYVSTIVPNWTTDEDSPAVSPSGTTIAFLTGCNGAMADSLALASMAGSLAPSPPCSDQILSTTSGGGLNHPTWGPRGLIAFSHPQDGNAMVNVIAVIDGASHLHELAPDGGRQMNPFWAPSTFQPTN